MIRWIFAMIGELIAFSLVTLSRFLPAPGKSKRAGQPILLVHGYINHGNVWLLHKWRLERAGLGPVYTISLGHPFKPIGHYAAKVQAMAEQIERETGRNDLTIVGHSMGGLVSALYACTLAKPGSVKSVITLGSPFAGTPIARIGLGQNARQMQPGAQFLRELKGYMQRSSLTFHHIAAKKDQIVVPGLSALNGQGTVFDMGHASLLYSKGVSKKLIEILSGN
jgi:triacylglycerol lipase